MKPPEAFQKTINQTIFPSPIGLSGLIDPNLSGSKAFQELGFGFLEIGPVTWNGPITQEGPKRNNSQLLFAINQEKISLKQAITKLAKLNLRIPVLVRIDQEAAAHECALIVQHLSPYADWFIGTTEQINTFFEPGKLCPRNIFISLTFDEIDKKISESGQSEIYTKAVIDSLLKMAEGHKYHIETKDAKFEIDTSFITFAMMGAFSGIEVPSEKIQIGGFGAPNSKKKEDIFLYNDKTLIKYGLKPEFLGRSKLVVMNSLGIDDFCKIITESDQSVLLLYKYLLEEIGIKLIYDSSCVEKIAKKADELGVGVRSIKKIVESAFELINYQIFSKGNYNELIITPETFDDNTKFILR